MAEYFNINGDPIGVSARDAVLAREPRAYLAKPDRVWRAGTGSETLLIIRRQGRAAAHWSDTILGTGVNEEAAWREALSRLRLKDEEEARWLTSPNHGRLPRG